MATVKVSALTEKTSPSGSEELLINDGGTSKKITIGNAFTDTNTTYTSSDFTHDDLTGFVSNEHIDWTGASAGTIHSSNYTDTNTTYSVQDGELSENNFTDADHTKLNNIETNADVTDATNVTSAGALMDSEVTNLADVKAFDTTDYATAAQGTTADAALPKAGGTMTGGLDLNDNVKLRLGTGGDLQLYCDNNNSYIKDAGAGSLLLWTGNGTEIKFISQSDGSETMADMNADGSVDLYYNNSKKFETSATGVDVTGVITTDGLTTSADISLGDDDKAKFGAGDDLQIYHSSIDNNSYIDEDGSGSLFIRGNNLILGKFAGETYVDCNQDGSVDLYYDNSKKLETTSTGVDVTGSATGTLTTDNDGSFDMSASNNFKCTPSGDFTLTFTNIVSQSGFILLVNSGGHTVSAHANSKVDANLLATVTAAGTYLISYFSDGTNVYLTNSAIYT